MQEKLGLPEDAQGPVVRQMVEKYIEGVCWVMKYYYEGAHLILPPRACSMPWTLPASTCLRLPAVSQNVSQQESLLCSCLPPPACTPCSRLCLLPCTHAHLSCSCSRQPSALSTGRGSSKHAAQTGTDGLRALSALKMARGSSSPVFNAHWLCRRALLDVVLPLPLRPLRL